MVLVTGASGEIGHGLIQEIAERGTFDVLALDVRPLDPDLALRCAAVRIGDILDRHLLDRVRAEFEISIVFRLAALLSTRAEFVPESAHEVNVQGTLNLLHLGPSRRPPRSAILSSSSSPARSPCMASRTSRPSTPRARWPRTPGWLRSPSTAVPSFTASIWAGISPGTIVSSPRRARAASTSGPSAFPACSPPSPHPAEERATAPEMIHAAARGRPYSCFVRPDTRIPFMVIPDAVAALLTLMDAPGESLTRVVYNVAAFSLSAAELVERINAAFPEAAISFAPDARRQAIVDSWPSDVDDTRARRDWDFQPAYDLEGAFEDYLLPNIKRHYARD